ncbi:MAG: hypothetical protein H2042_07155 [Rhizobiales bacterium]|nr:hypothetical protein [Hyphomicrobiales bacterium]
MSPPGSAELAGLRRRIAALEAGPAPTGRAGRANAWAEAPDGAGLGDAGRDPAILPLGIADVDHTLGGGFALGALHAASTAAPGQEGALLAFGLALAARALRRRRRPVLAVQQDVAGYEGGWLYGPGLEAAGLPEGALILVRVRRAEEALLVMEEALKCSGLAAVLGEVGTPLPDALTATRRLSLAARAGGGLGLLLRPAPDTAPCAAVTRWRIAPATSRPLDAFGGLGAPCLSADLTRNRHGPPGAWRLVPGRDGFVLDAGRGGLDTREARHDAGTGRRRAALSQPVAGPSLHRPDRGSLTA